MKHLLRLSPAALGRIVAFFSPLLLLLAGPQAAAQSFNWTYLAGPAAGRGVSDGTGTEARFLRISGITVDLFGNIYLSDAEAHTIRKATQAGVVTTLAGSPEEPGSADGTGSAARFHTPAALVCDQAGNVFVLDKDNHTIRKVTPAGVVTTFAGSAGVAGSADGTGGSARFNSPSKLTIDAADNLYVSDTGNHTIRKVTPAAVVTTVAGLAGLSGSTDGTGSAARFNVPAGIDVDGDGNLYVADLANSTIRKITSAGVVSTLAGVAGKTGSSDGTTNARFYYPAGLALGGDGNLYVADNNLHNVRRVAMDGTVTSIAGLALSPGSADGTGTAARFGNPDELQPDGTGSFFVIDYATALVRRVDVAGVVTTFLGSNSQFGSTDATGTAARFYYPQGAAVDAAGNAYVADTANNTIRKITSAGVVTTLAGSAGQSGSTNATGASARFNGPAGVCVDGIGNLFVADTQNHTIRKVTSAGVVTTLAGTAGQSGTADGTGSAARFTAPAGVCVDGGGNVYVADMYNHTIRKVTSGGVVTTLAGHAGQSGHLDASGTLAYFNTPSAIAIDASNNLYVADTFNHVIRKVTAAGVVTTFAGKAGQYAFADGTGSAARFSAPYGVAVDGSGNIYVADANNHRIRRITPAGVVTTIGGSSHTGNRGGLGAEAAFNSPNGVASTLSGTVYAVNTQNHTIFRGTDVTQPPVLSDPVSGASKGITFNASFTLPERALSGSVQLVFSGSASRTLTLASVAEAAGDHTISFYPANPLQTGDVLSISGGTSLPAGTYTVTLQYQDQAGNALASAAASNVVVDLTAPIISTPMQGFSPLTLTAGNGAVRTAPAPDYTSQALVSDDLGVNSVTQSPAPGAGLAVGLNTLILTAKDAAGNETTLAFDVTVLAGDPEAFILLSKGSLVPSGGQLGSGIPTGATWSGFGVPSINAAGQIAFAAYIKVGTQTFQGIFAGTLESQVMVACQGTLAPSSTGDLLGRPTFLSFKDPLLSDDGAITFMATLSGGGTTAETKTGVYSTLLSGGSLREIARTGAQPPGAPAGARWKGFAGLGQYGAGTASERAIALSATMVTGLGGVTSADDSAVWIASPSGMVLALREGATVAYLSQARQVQSFAALAPVGGVAGHGNGVGSLGQMAVKVTFADGFSTVTRLGQGGLSPLADLPGFMVADNAAPGGGTFTELGLPTGSTDGTVAFAGKFDNGAGPVGAVYGQYVDYFGAHTVRHAAEGDSAGATGALFGPFGNPITDGNGAAAFLSDLTGTGVTASTNTSLWWRPSIVGSHQLMAREGSVATEALAAAKVPAGVQPLPIWKSFTALALPQGQGPLFVATLVNRTGATLPGPGGVTAANDVGLWGTDSEGNLRLLLREGDKIGPAKVKSFTALGAVSGSPAQRRSFNDAGQVLVRVIDSTGAQHLVLIGVP